MHLSDSKEEKRNPFSKEWSSIILIIGVIELIFSILFNSAALAFTGLGLFFFGAILSYIGTESHIKKTILDATVVSQILTSTEMAKELNYDGQAVYLPSRYLDLIDTPKMYIPRRKELKNTTAGQINELSTSLNNSRGCLFTPFGSELTKLFEKALGKNLIGADLPYLQQNLPRVFKELGIARELSIIEKGTAIFVTIEDCRFTLESESNLESGDTHPWQFPLNSAIACALVKVTNRPLTVANHQSSGHGRNVLIEYRLVDDWPI